MPTVVGVYNEWAIAIVMVAQTVAIALLLGGVRKSSKSFDKKIDELHATFNSKMDRLLKVTGDEGFLRGRQEERDRHQGRGGMDRPDDRPS